MTGIYIIIAASLLMNIYNFICIVGLSNYINDLEYKLRKGKKEHD